MNFDAFPRYTEYDPLVPVVCVTPDLPGCIHRFFDTSPISPSGRYLAVFQMPFEDRRPEPGEWAGSVLSIWRRREARVVAETCGWEPQMGANINWGGSDHELFFNDVDTDDLAAILVEARSALRRTHAHGRHGVPRFARWPLADLGQHDHHAQDAARLWRVHPGRRCPAQRRPGRRTTVFTSPTHGPVSAAARIHRRAVATSRSRCRHGRSVDASRSTVSTASSIRKATG